MRRVLVATDRLGRDNLARLARHAEVVEASKTDSAGIKSALPSVDAAVILGRPPYFTPENLAEMRKLRLVQSLTVGFNQVKFQDLPPRVRVCGNAGSFSVPVGEHAWGLILDAAKWITKTDSAIKSGGKSSDDFRGGMKDALVLKGGTMGILGYGGIGRTVGRYASAFGMKVLAYGRGKMLLRGRSGLERVLKESDVVLVSLPLTRLTEGLIGRRELRLMKKNAVLANVARGDIVDQKALFEHLNAEKSFRYATDVWWYRDGKESLASELRIETLDNFIGTPHTSGPAGVATGDPQKAAVDNVIRWLLGREPKNVVDRDEYLR